MPENKSPIPIGVHDFKELVEKGFYFVDKSLMIKSLCDVNFKVYLLLRPRRFGKTLHLSMLKYYYDCTQNNAHLFDRLAIANAGDKYRNEMGKYPVILITLRGIRSNNWDVAKDKLIDLIASLYAKYKYLLESDKISLEDKKVFKNIIASKATPAQVDLSLRKLSEYLQAHHEQKVIILIDEYDTPIYEAFHNHYNQEMITFLRDFIGEALKDNDALQMGVVTGILRIAKESLFSGINNLKIYSVLDEGFSQYFGWSEQEVSKVLDYYGFTDAKNDVKKWYNGYTLGANERLYNPWSILNFVADKAKHLKPYWINTGNPALLKKVLAQSDKMIKADIELLLQGKSINQTINENLSMPDLNRGGMALWTLLLFSGYVTALPQKTRKLGDYQLRIPNEEVKQAFWLMITDWFTQSVGSNYLHDITQSLLAGEIDTFKVQLARYLRQTLSYFDISGKEPERFYHALVLGMLVHLSGKYEIKSNRESGFGRYDVLLIPIDKNQLGIILEFKVAFPEIDKSLSKAANAALKQIEAKNYQSELSQQGIKKILAVGIAFQGKEVAVQEKTLYC